MHVYGELTGVLTAPATLSGALSAPALLQGELTIPQFIYPPSYEDGYEVTPDETEQVLATGGLKMDSDLTVHAIPSDYVGSSIDRRSGSDLTASGATVSVPGGYYEENASKSISNGTAVPASAITAIDATLTASDNKLSLYRECINAPYVSQAGYIDSGTQGKTKITLIADVNTRTSSDLTASGDTVTAPAGYYGSSASKSVQSGSATTPTGGITANPSISVSSGGLITASVSKSESITPIISEGYVTSGTAGTITFSGSKTEQLSTQAGTTVSPTESEQTAVASGKYTTGAVKVGAIPADYVGSGITRRDSDDLSASGATVTALSGYYAENASKSVASGSASTPATSITATPSISVNTSTGVISSSVSATKSVTPTVSAGYVSSGTSGTITVSGSNTSNLSTVNGATVSPTESEQTAVAANKYTLGAIKVGAISSSYVGSGVTRRASADLSASGATVTAPAGYYAQSATKTVASGTEGTPTATKGTVSNHSIAVTPSVTNSAGYISGGSHNGTAVTVSASELVSGTKSITSNGTGIDVANYAAVDVAVSSGSPNLQTKSKSYTPTESQQTEAISYDSGYDGLDTVNVTVGAISSTYVGSGITQRSSSDMSANGATVTAPAGYYASAGTKTVSSGSATGPASISSSGATASSNGTNVVLTKTVSVTPSVSAGYVASGTASNCEITMQASDANFLAENIKSGVSLFGKTGSYTGGGSSKNVQVLQSTSRTSSSSLTKVLGDLTVSKTGTYDIYWSAGRSNTSTSYTWGSRLYVDGSGYGTENTSWSNNVQNNHLTNVSLTANQKLSVYTRGRSGSYYTFAPMLVIIEA